MKALVRLVLPTLLVISAGAASIEGKITFALTKFGSRAAFSGEFGDDLKATCDWKAVSLLGKETLFAGAKIRNAGSNALWFVYSVAFFDEDKKLVGAASMPLFTPEPLEPGQAQQLSCVVYLPPGRYQDIASYQAILYELDEPVIRGRKKPVQLEDPEKTASEVRTNKTR